MSTELRIPHVEAEVMARLRERAGEHGRSLEHEALEILRSELLPTGLGSRIHARFAAVGGVDLELPDRAEIVRRPTF